MKAPSPAEINRELQILKRCFNLAVEEGRLLHTPHIPMLAEHNVRQGFLEPEQLQDLLAFLPSELQPVIRFAYLTGWRIASDAAARMVAGGLRSRGSPARPGHDQKRRRPGVSNECRSPGLTLAQKRLTDALQRERGAVIPVVFHRQGVPIVSLSKAWRSACRAAGCPGRILHDLRRSSIRNMVRTEFRDGGDETQRP